MVRFLGLAIVYLSIAAATFAQQASNRVRTAAFLEVVAQRGLACDLLQPWQAAALRALNLQDMRGWSEQQTGQVIAEVDRQLAETECDNAAMTTWIEGSSRGFDSEMLPPYLVAYRLLARMEHPPQVFSATALRLDYAPAIAAIDAKFAELEASGAVAEGGHPWPEYVSRTEASIQEFIGTLENPATSGGTADEAASWLAQSARIVELWLADID